LKTRVRSAATAIRADCGHVVAAGHAVVRRGRRWVCTGCSLPEGPHWGALPPCSCGSPIVPPDRIALGSDGQWRHRQCTEKPVALATCSDGVSYMGM
jgi:hypothetical protein